MQIGGFDSLLRDQSSMQVPAAAADPRGGQRAMPTSAAPAVEENLTWERGDKFARGVVTEPDPGAIGGIAGKDLTEPIPVKSHVRGAPGAEKKAKKAITLDAIVAEYRRAIRANTARHLFMGEMIDTWLRKPPEDA